jgi:hypothetical protein
MASVVGRNDELVESELWELSSQPLETFVVAGLAFSNKNIFAISHEICRVKCHFLV